MHFRFRCYWTSVFVGSLLSATAGLVVLAATSRRRPGKQRVRSP